MTNFIVNPSNKPAQVVSDQSAFLGHTVKKPFERRTSFLNIWTGVNVATDAGLGIVAVLTSTWWFYDDHLLFPLIRFISPLGRVPGDLESTLTAIRCMVELLLYIQYDGSNGWCSKSIRETLKPLRIVRRPIRNYRAPKRIYMSWQYHNTNDIFFKVTPACRSTTNNGSQRDSAELPILSRRYTNYRFGIMNAAHNYVPGIPSKFQSHTLRLFSNSSHFPTIARRGTCVRFWKTGFQYLLVITPRFAKGYPYPCHGREHKWTGYLLLVSLD